MERYNRQDRTDYRDNRRDDRYDDRRSDDTHFRGAYRLDNESSSRNRSTYNMNNTGSYRQNKEQGGDYVYRRSRNLQDNDGYTEQQYRHSYPSNPDRNSYEGRSGNYSSMDRNFSRSEEQNRQTYRPRHNEGISGNFDGDYSPDRYSNRPGENYGNMAGSLSFGYDGDYNSDPDYNRRYNPLTGEIRQRQEDYSERHPRRYGPPDRTGSNPDYDRY